MITRGRIESDGTRENTRIWLAGQEITHAIQRIEWVIDAKGVPVEAAVTVTFLAKVTMDIEVPPEKSNGNGEGNDGKLG